MFLSLLMGSGQQIVDDVNDNRMKIIIIRLILFIHAGAQKHVARIFYDCKQLFRFVLV